MLYERVCESYHAVDDFRMKLLGLLPVATGTAVFLLLSGKADLLGSGDHASTGTATALFAIGAFGLLFTIGLFAYELFGVKKCHYLIAASARLERTFAAEAVNGSRGQFLSRPRELAGFINEPFASAIIYPASMAAWVFLGLAAISETAAATSAIAVVILGGVGTYLGVRRIKINQEREDLVLTATGEGRTLAELEDDVVKQWKAHCADTARTHDGSRWVDATVNRLARQGVLERNGSGSVAWLRPRSHGMWNGPKRD
jgi:hypothetical protein